MLYSIQNQFLKVEAAERGAELQSIRDVNGTEYLWQGDPSYWPDRAPNLFPYVARLTDESYYLDGELHRMKIHGFAPYLDFTVKEKSPERLVLELVSNEETLAAYPRRFAFRVIYELQGSALAVTYDENSCLPLVHELFDRDAIVLKDAGHKVSLYAKEGGRGITVEFPGMDYLGLWHLPGTDAPYLCIEPWCSLPSTKGKIAVLEEQKDLIALPADKTYRNSWRITINCGDPF